MCFPKGVLLTQEVIPNLKIKLQLFHGRDAHRWDHNPPWQLFQQGQGIAGTPGSRQPDESQGRKFSCLSVLWWKTAEAKCLWQRGLVFQHNSWNSGKERRGEKKWLVRPDCVLLQQLLWAGSWARAQRGLFCVLSAPSSSPPAMAWKPTAEQGARTDHHHPALASLYLSQKSSPVIPSWNGSSCTWEHTLHWVEICRIWASDMICIKDLL